MRIARVSLRRRPATAILFARAIFRVKLRSKEPRFVYQEPHLFVTNEASFPETRIGQGMKGAEGGGRGREDREAEEEKKK